MKRTKKKCEWCGETITISPFPSHIKRFCDKSCSAKWRNNQPEIQKALSSNERSRKISQALKKAHIKNPNWAKKASQRMKENNPTQDPAVRKKIKKTFREFGHPLAKQQIKGGNGRPLPRAQRILFAALGEGWKVEYPIPTKKSRNSGFPTNYKADIALPEKKVWIEIDGWVHELEETKKKDRKKEQLLQELGWKGLRFWNHEVENNLPNVLSTIYKFLDTLHTTPRDS